MTIHTLHVGINDYTGTENDLAGCVNDARNAARLLGLRRRGAVRDAIDQCRFFGDAATVTTLTNKQCTRAKGLAAIAELLGRLERDDWGVVTWSGHGTYVRDKNGD